MSIKTPPSLLPLGAPPWDDVEAAARLLVEYRRIGMREETAEVFCMSVHDLDAVLTRAAELEAERKRARPKRTALNSFVLGEPDRTDVESAARLYLEYDREGLLTDDVASSLAMMVDDYERVYARAAELKRAIGVEGRSGAERPQDDEIRELARQLVGALWDDGSADVETQAPKPAECPSCGRPNVLRCVCGHPWHGPPLAADEYEYTTGDVLSGNEPAWHHPRPVLPSCRRVGGQPEQRHRPRQALRAALRTRRLAPGLVHHSDRGSPYASAEYRSVLAENEVIASMSRKGDCWDNAVAESFFGTLKAELVDHHQYATHDDATRSIGEYIDDFYNIERRHSTLDYLNPIEFELRAGSGRQVA